MCAPSSHFKPHEDDENLNYDCECEDGYELLNNDHSKCYYKCDTSKHFEVNDENDGCKCEMNYNLVDGECKLKCNIGQIASENNSQCVCDKDNGYVEDHGSCILFDIYSSSTIGVMAILFAFILLFI